MIKVVHLCSSNTGGAGIAAHRLNKALRDYGIDSRMLCLNKNGNDPSVEKFNIPLISRILNHIPIPYRLHGYPTALPHDLEKMAALQILLPSVHSPDRKNKAP